MKNVLTNSVQSILNYNSKLSEEIRNQKFTKMSDSLFRFFRGTNHLYWEYFSENKALKKFGNEATKTWLLGDLHPYNYGLFKDKSGQLVYDLNDFDETFFGDFQLDLLRMLAALVIVAWENDKLTENEIEDVISSFSNEYISSLFNWKFRFKMKGKHVFGNFVKSIKQNNNRKNFLQKWTVKTGDSYKLNTEIEDLVALDNDLYADIKQAFLNSLPELCENLEPQDIQFIDSARRISAGTGSLGVNRFYILAKSNLYGKPFILDVKKQLHPTAFWTLSESEKQTYLEKVSDEAERHIHTRELMQPAAKNFLGVLRMREETYAMSERSPYRSYFPTEELSKLSDYKLLAKIWGKILAKNHFLGSHESFILELKKKTLNNYKDFSNLMTKLAFEFANKNKNDYQEFLNYLKF